MSNNNPAVLSKEYHHSPPAHRYLRSTFQGGQGSGKTFTAGLIALGVALASNKRPVLAWDSETSWEFLEDIFAIEGVPLIIVPGGSFKSLIDSFERVKVEGACFHISDQLAAPWSELQRAFSDDSGYIGMERRQQMRGHWDESFVLAWKDLPCHAIACGRLGYEYLDYEDEDGHRKFAKGESKMRAGGSESFGYEGDLECEFSRVTEPTGITHVCEVRKDRTRCLNGERLIFRDFREYRRGLYRESYEAFLPHLERLAKMRPIAIPQDSSRDLLHTESWWKRTDRERKSLLEEWDVTMEHIVTGRTQAAETFRRTLEESITGLRSRTRFEQLPVGHLESCVLILMRFEERYKTGERPTDERAIHELVGSCRRDMGDTRGKDMTLAELMRPPAKVNREEHVAAAGD